jgi:quercetin dioxygenase-like cupin family protein
MAKLDLRKPGEAAMIVKVGLWLALTAISFGAGLAVAQTTTQTGREPQFENAEVKVWKSVVLPHSPLPLHRHEHPRVIIALTGGTMQIVEENGSTETHDWKTGKAYWLPANAPGTRHQDVNVGDKPIEVMVVELQSAK